MSVPPTVEASSASPAAPPLLPAAPALRNRARAAAIATTAVVTVVVGGAAGYVGGHEAGSGGAATSPALASSPSGEMNVPAVLARVEPAVVTVHTDLVGENATGQPVAERGTGTGFVVRSDGLIATRGPDQVVGPPEARGRRW